MKQVTVDRDTLLARITANRDAHRAVFEDALKGYRAKVIEELDRALKDAREGIRYRTHIRLVQPEDHTKEYDLIIDMLTNSVDDEITLDANAYNAYMRDEWSWKRQFAASNAAYTTMIAAPGDDDEVW